LLTTAPLDPGANCLIGGRNIRDASLANVIVTEIQSPVGLEATLFPFETRWAFWSFGTFPGENWMQPDYDDSSWPGAPGDQPAYAPFAHSPQDIRNAPVHTAISVGPARPAFYFRKVFDFPGSLIGSKIFLRQIVDEGAVFYLNGVEVHRIGMPPGPVSHQ
jgi:trimeric autotransporter adhesin